MSMPRQAAMALLTPFVSGLRLNPTDEGACGGGTPSFADFVEEHGRSYQVGSDEYAMRESLYSKRALEAEAHNCNEAGIWHAAANHLADWTAAELRGLLGHRSRRRSQGSGGPGGLLGGAPMVLAAGRAFQQPDDLPGAFSWGNLSSIQETWDQGNCGSCWAVAASTTMRAHAEIRGRQRAFSANQLIACTPNPNQCGGTGGCDGATAELAYEYVMEAGLAGDDAEFTRLGGTRDFCPLDKRISSVEVTRAIGEVDGTEVHRLPTTGRAGGGTGRALGMVGWSKLPENKEMPLVRALVQHGPVYVAVAAGDGWFSYAGGVLTPGGCDENHVVNHAVVLYGYGVKPKTRIGDVRYWHIKNSWGANWGEAGSIRLQRLDAEESECFWDKEPSQGSGCKGGPSRVWVCGSCGILYDGVVPTFAH